MAFVYHRSGFRNTVGVTNGTGDDSTIGYDNDGILRIKCGDEIILEHNHDTNVTSLPHYDTGAVIPPANEVVSGTWVLTLGETVNAVWTPPTLVPGNTGFGVADRVDFPTITPVYHPAPANPAYGGFAISDAFGNVTDYTLWDWDVKIRYVWQGSTPYYGCMEVVSVGTTGVNLALYLSDTDRTPVDFRTDAHTSADPPQIEFTLTGTKLMTIE